MKHQTKIAISTRLSDLTKYFVIIFNSSCLALSSFFASASFRSASISVFSSGFMSPFGATGVIGNLGLLVEFF